MTSSVHVNCVCMQIVGRLPEQRKTPRRLFLENAGLMHAAVNVSTVQLDLELPASTVAALQLVCVTHAVQLQAPRMTRLSFQPQA